MVELGKTSKPHSHIPTPEVTTSNMFSNIWNPFIHVSQAVEQEEPLDLSMKETKVKNVEERPLTLPSSSIPIMQYLPGHCQFILVLKVLAHLRPVL